MKNKMATAIQTLKFRMLATDPPRWKRIVSATVLTLLCAGMALWFCYLYLTMPALACYNGFFYLAVVWLAVELLLIAYLFQTKVIPQFVRDAIEVLLAFSNIWFCLFVFGLKACT